MKALKRTRLGRIKRDAEEGEQRTADAERHVQETLSLLDARRETLRLQLGRTRKGDTGGPNTYR